MPSITKICVIADCTRPTAKDRRLCVQHLYQDRARKYPLIGIWSAMIARCYNPKSELYERYGRQGITVCQRWRSSYQAFASDMGPKPSPSHTLERIDGTKGYEPGNVRWATRFEQVMNQRIRSDNTSGFRGVSRRRNYWKAAIWFEETQIYIGLFKTAEEAAYVRDQFALELHGSAAYLNVL